jgi:uncharacterized protein (DUF1501 family)
MNRRQLLVRAAATSIFAQALALPARGAAGPSDRKFLFVFAHGGWDTTRVFSPEFDNPNVSMERAAEPWSVGNLRLVDGPGRPSVRAFFTQHHGISAVIDGLLVPSVAHETCSQIVMTGGTRGNPDWAALLAGVQSDRYVLPNLVVDAPSFPATFGRAVARSGSNGQLDGLVDGSLLEQSDVEVRLPSRSTEGAIDRYLLRRAAAARLSPRVAAEAELLDGFAEAQQRATDLENARFATQFGSNAGFSGKLRVATEALATGLSRTVSLAFPDPYFSWDSHTDNDAQQTVLWEALFAGLLELQELLSLTPGTSGSPLSEEVVVVVVSEMGRTPLLNGDNGKDHWPYTSALLFGPGIAGDRQVGGMDELFQGRPIDLATGETSEGGVVPTASHLGATLLAAADEDPAQWLPGYGPVEGLLG